MLASFHPDWNWQWRIWAFLPNPDTAGQQSVLWVVMSLPSQNWFLFSFCNQGQAFRAAQIWLVFQKLLSANLPLKKAVLSFMPEASGYQRLSKASLWVSFEICFHVDILYMCRQFIFFWQYQVEDGNVAIILKEQGDYTKASLISCNDFSWTLNNLKIWGGKQLWFVLSISVYALFC